MKTGKGYSVAALILGIVATVLAWFYMINIAALVCGIVGIVSLQPRAENRLLQPLRLPESAQQV